MTLPCSPIRQLVRNTAIAIAFSNVFDPPQCQHQVFLSTHLIVASFWHSGMHRSRQSIPLPEGLPVGQLIGRKGSNIRHLQSKSGARIAVRGDAGIVTVTGSAFDIIAALSLLEAQFASWRSSGTAGFRIRPEFAFTAPAIQGCVSIASND